MVAPVLECVLGLDVPVKSKSAAVTKVLGRFQLIPAQDLPAVVRLLVLMAGQGAARECVRVLRESLHFEDPLDPRRALGRSPESDGASKDSVEARLVEALRGSLRVAEPVCDALCQSIRKRVDRVDAAEDADGPDRREGRLHVLDLWGLLILASYGGARGKVAEQLLEAAASRGERACPLRSVLTPICFRPTGIEIAGPAVPRRIPVQLHPRPPFLAGGFVPSTDPSGGPPEPRQGPACPRGRRRPVLLSLCRVPVEPATA